jgi:hypothetical protein
MKKLGLALAAFAASLTVLISPAEVRAQGAVWLSGDGSNGNNCLTPAQACRFFGGVGGALEKIAAGGTIHVLPGDYDSVEIEKSVSIVAEEGQADISGIAQIVGTVAATLVVNAGPEDVVRIRGMFINPTVAGSSVGLVSGRALHLEDCTFIGTTGAFGVHVAPTSGVSELYMSNTRVAENGTSSAGGGILLLPTGSGSVRAELDNVHVENNRTGFLASSAATSGTVAAVIRDSVFFGNTSFGIVSSQARSVVRVADSTVSGNGGGLARINGGQIISHGGNLFAANSNNGSFSSVVPQQ